MTAITMKIILITIIKEITISKMILLILNTMIILLITIIIIIQIFSTIKTILLKMIKYTTDFNKYKT
jgi:hypothetical protein